MLILCIRKQNGRYAPFKYGLTNRIWPSDDDEIVCVIVWKDVWKIKGGGASNIFFFMYLFMLMHAYTVVFCMDTFICSYYLSLPTFVRRTSFLCYYYLLKYSVQTIFVLKRKNIFQFDTVCLKGRTWIFSWTGTVLYIVSYARILFFYTFGWKFSMAI